jgi:hypothetical protein
MMKITRFANFLRIVLPSSDALTMEMAARALGNVSKVGANVKRKIGLVRWYPYTRFCGI